VHQSLPRVALERDVPRRATSPDAHQRWPLVALSA
jgi:hypothetical protein